MGERLIISRDTLDKQTQEYFNKVLGKDINDLNLDDIGFLKARTSYLTEEEIEKYSEVLFSNTVPESTSTESTTDKSKKKSKKK